MEPLSISTGKPADGKENYFQRPQIEATIWSKIDKKEHLLLAAPRRTGKSSILKNLERNPKKGYLVKYKSVQHIDGANEFFKQIYKLLLEDDSIFSVCKRHLEKSKGAVTKFVSRVRGISFDGIDIDPRERVDYYNECEKLLKMLPDNFDTVLLLIDEFPDAVKNISMDDSKKGVRFLQLTRGLRQDFNDANIQFVYSGSIGLGNVVAKLNRRDLINDIVNIEVPPLSEEEAKEFISRLVLGLTKDRNGFEINDDIKEYIFKKESWLIPYYIQIVVDELFAFFTKTHGTVTEKSIDDAIDKIICDRYKYQDYFENWKTRLKQAFERSEYRCAIEILNGISSSGSMDYNSIYNVSIKHGVDDLKDIANVLEYDGYINKDKEKTYRFNSIILKEWWYINVAT